MAGGRRRSGTVSDAGSLVRAAVLLAGALLAAGCSGDAHALARQPHILLVVCDSLRADRLPLYGAERDTAPWLTAWAEDALVYEHATSPSNRTRPSVLALFTGRHPADGRSLAPSLRLPGHEALLPEQLAAAGYETLGVSANPLVSAVHGADRGFDEFLDLGALGDEHAGHWKDRIAAPFVLGRVEHMLDSRAHSERPVFLYVHLMDTHLPYDPPDELRRDTDPDYAGDFDGGAAAYARLGRSGAAAALDDADRQQLAALYDGEVARLDRGLARLSELAAQYLGDRDVVTVLTADHGELLGDGPDGGFGHGRGLGPQLLHVPLVVAGAGAGGRVSTRVGLVDVAPTLLALAGAEPLLDIDGVDLLAPDGPPAGRDLIAYSAPLSSAAGPDAPLARDGLGELAVLRDTWRAERRRGSWRLFEISSGEDVSAYRADLLPQLTAAAARWSNHSRARSAFGEEFDRVQLGARATAALDALGYAGDG